MKELNDYEDIQTFANKTYEQALKLGIRLSVNPKNGRIEWVRIK